jgi:RNA-directed DNA polymerase
VIEPIFEADLEPNAYGYRPQRSATDAIREVHKALCDGQTLVAAGDRAAFGGLCACSAGVVDADLSKYFDTIPHDALMQCVARRIVDRMILSLIKMWLKAPVEERDRDGKRRMTGGKGSKHGTPRRGEARLRHDAGSSRRCLPTSI